MNGETPEDDERTATIQRAHFVAVLALGVANLGGPIVWKSGIAHRCWWTAATMVLSLTFVVGAFTSAAHAMGSTLWEAVAETNRKIRAEAAESLGRFRR